MFDSTCFSWFIPNTPVGWHRNNSLLLACQGLQTSWFGYPCDWHGLPSPLKRIHPSSALHYCIHLSIRLGDRAFCSTKSFSWTHLHRSPMSFSPPLISLSELRLSLSHICPTLFLNFYFLLFFLLKLMELNSNCYSRFILPIWFIANVCH